MVGVSWNRELRAGCVATRGTSWKEISVEGVEIVMV